MERIGVRRREREREDCERREREGEEKDFTHKKSLILAYG